MSKNVDERVVQMEFDNKRFEQNVQTSMKSIEQLKQSLDFSGVGNTIIVVGEKFSMLEQIAIGALRNIGQEAYQTGKRLIKSLTIDQISVGWEKFAEKTTAVQTIMAATRETWQDSANAMARASWLMENGLDQNIANNLAQQAGQIKDGIISATDAIEQSGGQATASMLRLANGMTNVVYQGDQMSFVSEQLERLNWFTDETSYKLVDMASNIGKFTAAGVGLDKAVSAMEGIATWAAISGGNANSASIAMYNMSQALGSGAVLAVDWKSIENQNMATAEFKQIVIDTAEELGTLRKLSDDTWATMDDNVVSVKNFRENLKDRWFSDEVLMGSLQKYGDFAVELQQVAAETDLSAKELLDGLTAYKEASAGMGEYLVSQGINDELAKGVAERYKQIASGMMSMEQAAEELGTTPAVISNLTKRLDGFMDGAVDFEAMLEEIKETCPDTTLTIEDLRKEFNHLTDDTMDLGMRAFKAAQEAKTFQEAIDYVREAVSTGWLKTFEKIFGNYEEAKELWSNLAEEFYTLFVEAGDIRNSILDTWKEAGGRDDLVEAFWNIFHAIMAVVDAIKGAIKDVFNPLLSDEETGASRLWTWTHRLKEFSETLKLTDDETGELNETGQKLKSTFKGVFAIFGIIGDVLKALIKPIFKLIPGIGDISSGVLDATASFGDMLVALRETINSSEFLEGVTKRLSNAFAALSTFAGSMMQIFRGVSYIEGGEGFSGIVNSIFDSVVEVVRLGFDLVSALFDKDFDEIKENVVSAIQTVRDTVVDYLYDTVFDASVIGDWLRDVIDNLKNLFGSFGDIDLSGAQTFADKFRSIMDSVKEKLEKVRDFFQKVSPVFKAIGAAIGGVLYGIGAIFAVLGEKIASFLKEASVLDIVNVISGLAKAFLSFKLGKFLGSITEFPEKINAFTEALTNFTKKLKTITKNLGNNVLKFALSLAIIVAAVYALSTIDIPAMITAGTVLASLMYLLHKVTENMGTTFGKDQKFKSGATQILAFSVAVLILAKALKKISDIEPTQMLASVAAIGTLVLILYAVTKRMTKFGDMSTGLSQIMALGAAVLILSMAMKKIGQLDWGQIARGLVVLTAVITELAVVMRLMKKDILEGDKTFGDAISEMLFLLAFAAAVKKLVNVMLDLAGLSWTDLAKGVVGLTVVIGEMLVATKLMEKSSKGAKATTSMAIGLLILVGVIKLMAAMEWGTIGKGLLVIAAAFATLAISALLLKPVESTIVKLSKALWKIGVGVLAIAAAMALFAIAAPLFVASAALIGKGIEILVLQLVSALPRIIAALAESIIQSASDIVEMIAGLIGLICAAIRAKAQDIVDTVFDLIVMVLDGLAARSEAITAALLDIFIVGPIKGIADKVPELAEALRATFEALMDAFTVFGNGDMLESLAAVSTLEKIAWKFLLIAGMTRLASGTLEKIGTSLADFGNNAKPFFDVLRTVGADQLQASVYVADMIRVMTGTGVLDALTSWFTGKTRLTDLGKELADFAPDFRRFANTVKDIKSEGVIETSKGIKAMADVWVPYIDSSTYEEFGKGLASLGPNIAKFSTDVAGISDSVRDFETSGDVIKNLSSVFHDIKLMDSDIIVTFGESLVAFAPYLVEYGTIVSMLNNNSVIASTMSANAVVDFVERIPTEGDVFWSRMAGKNDMIAFGEGLVAFGQSLVSYSIVVSLLNTGSLLNSMMAADAIVHFANSIPNDGGDWGNLWGNNNMEQFGKDLENFGKALVSYSLEVAMLNSGALLSSMAAANAIIDMAKRIPNDGGDWGELWGNNDLGDFAKGLANFGRAMQLYSEAISNISDFQRIEDSMVAATAITTFADTIPNGGGWLGEIVGNNQIGDFGLGLIQFGSGMAGYFNAIASIGFQRIVDSMDAAHAIVEFANLIPNQGGLWSLLAGDNTLKKFGEGLADFGTGMGSYFAAISSVGFQRIVDSTDAAKALVDIANLVPKQGGLWNKLTTGSKDMKKFGEGLEGFAGGLATYSNAIGSINFQRISDSVEPVSSLLSLGADLGEGSFNGWLFGYKTLEGFGQNLVAFGTSLTDFYSQISSIDTTVFGRISAAINILNTIDYAGIDPVATSMQDILDVVFALGNADPENIKGVSEALKEFTSIGLTEMAAIFEDPEEISPAIDTFSTNVGDLLSEKESDFEDAAKELVKALVDKMASELRNSKTSLNPALDSMTQAIRGYRYRFYQAGGYLVEGFVGGIDSNRWKAEAAAKAMAKAAEDAAKAELEQNSPSKKFYNIGSGTVEGMVNAMYDGIRAVYQSGTKLAEAAHKGTSEAIKKVADFVSYGMDAQPTIRPVLDLTDVAAGFGQLNTMFGHKQAISIGARMNNVNNSGSETNPTVNGIGANYNFVQNNYSPKALNAAEIYRLTKNQFSQVKGWVPTK